MQTERPWGRRSGKPMACGTAGTRFYCSEPGECSAGLLKKTCELSLRAGLGRSRHLLLSLKLRDPVN